MPDEKPIVTEPKEPKRAVASPLTKEEHKILKEDDTPPPEGFTKAEPALATVAIEEKPEPPKEEAKPEAEKEEKPQKEDFFVRLEREMSKPEGKENLGDFSPREKAYFYQMRRDRKLRQQAELDRDKALFRETRLKEETAIKKDQKPTEPKEEDPFEGRDDSDILTVEDAKKIFAKKDQKPPVVSDEADKAARSFNERFLKMCEKEAASTHNDFYPVMELSDDLLANNPEALSQITERTRAGENPAIVMYELIKGHKDFETIYPAAELRWKAKEEAKKTSGKEVTPGATSSVPEITPEEKAKTEKAKQAEQTLEENINRDRTTAHVSSHESKPAGELTFEEIAKMKDSEFAQLPRAVRNRYLRKFEGV